MKRSLRKPVAGTKAIPFTVYLPAQLDRWLREQAAVHGRTLTSQTVRVLERGKSHMSVESETSVG